MTRSMPIFRKLHIGHLALWLSSGLREALTCSDSSCYIYHFCFIIPGHDSSQTSGSDLLCSKYFRENQQQLVQCLLIVGTNIAKHTDAHCHGNGHSFIVREETEHRHGFVFCTVCVLCAVCSVRACLGRYVHTYGVETHFCVSSQGHSVAECTKRGRAAVVVSVIFCAVHTASVTTPPSLPHSYLICQSFTVVASFPLSPLFFPFLNPHPLFLHFCSCAVAPCFVLPPPLAVPCSTSSVFSLALSLSFALAFSLLSLPPSLCFPLTVFRLQSQCSSVWIAGMLL